MIEKISKELREAINTELALLTEEIEKYAKDVVEDYETNGTDLGGTITQVNEHSPILEEDPDPKDIPTIETYEGNSQEDRSFSGGVDWRNS